jgi:phosphatidylglycerophosphate synthase
MFDRYLHPLTGRFADRLAPFFAQRGISADQLSVLGLMTGFAALPLLAFEHYSWALVAFLSNRIIDALDGAVARLSGPTDRGAFLDIALDFFVYGAVPMGFALAQPERNALSSAVLLFSFIGTGSSFLGLAVFAQRRGISAPQFPRKGLYFIGGFAEGFETIVCFVLMCLFPAQYTTFAWIFAVLCFATTLMRWWWGYRLLSL